MARYDSGWWAGYGRDFEGRGEDRYARGWRGPEGGPFGAGRGPRGGRDRWGGYGAEDFGPPPGDRGVYGQGYPGFREYQRPGGRASGRGGYDAPFADRPFMPEQAYRGNPEYGGPSRHTGGRWPDAASGSAYGHGMDDHEVMRMVRESLYGDTWVDADRIDVEVSDGVVTLTGKVSDFMEARYAWDDAWETPGVRGVLNQLTVNPGPDEAE